MAEAFGKSGEVQETPPGVRSSNDDAEQLEMEHFVKVIQAFLAYRSCSLRKLEKRIRDFTSIPLWHRKMIPEYAKRLKESKSCIDENHKLIQLIVNGTDGMFRNSDFGVAG